MSGYDETTGMYRLKASKMRRHLDAPLDKRVTDQILIGYCAAVFHQAGFQIPSLDDRGFYVVADEAQVRETLSGVPSRSGHYFPPASQVYEAWMQRCLKESKARAAKAD